ncbi:MAG: DUF1593 domain-containing protein [Oscillatoriales cyanobacterium SM2_3_0]|nr:DUF1593 domain-containing protein [Oscillatoriales cyanobacterium SM2_3_0]
MAKIVGTNGNDVLKGTSGNDQLSGQAGNDTLVGVDLKNPNSPQKDQLIGGSGADVFVLGDETQSYYNLQNWSNIARILDFSASEGDRIQLHGDPGDYSLKISADQKSTHIKYQGDVIAAVNGKLNLKGSEFSYVGGDGAVTPIPIPTPPPAPTPTPTPIPTPNPTLQPDNSDKPRVIISTDIGGGDGDDEQSLIHALFYGNEVDFKGIIASPSADSDRSPSDGLKVVDSILDAYAKDYNNLKTWGGFPNAR